MSIAAKFVDALRNALLSLLAKRRAKPPVIRVPDAPRFDDRNSIDRFRRESGR